MKIVHIKSRGRERESEKDEAKKLYKCRRVGKKLNFVGLSSLDTEDGSHLIA